MSNGEIYVCLNILMYIYIYINRYLFFNLFFFLTLSKLGHQDIPSYQQMQAAAPTRQPVNARWLSAVPRSAFCENLGGASHVEIFGKEHMFCLMIVYYFYYILYYFYLFLLLYCILLLCIIVYYYCSYLLLYVMVIIMFTFFSFRTKWQLDFWQQRWGIVFASPKQVTWNFYHKNLCPRYKDTLWGAQ